MPLKKKNRKMNSEESKLSKQYQSMTALEHILKKPDTYIGAIESDEMKGRQYSIYKNVITNHGNIITTFQATQQLKIMLGEVSDGVKEANEALLEDKNRRLQLEDCVNTTSADGFKRGCNQTSCEDITKLCDGSPNYPYIATLRQGEFLIIMCRF